MIGAFIGLACGALYWAAQQFFSFPPITPEKALALVIIGAILFVALVDVIYLISEWRS